MKDREVDQDSAKPRPAPFVGRKRELAALAGALRARRSCLVTGPLGIGKSRLVEEALCVAGQPFQRLARPRALHDLLVDLARRWPQPADSADLRRTTSIALKPLVLDALRTKPCCLVLEDMAAVEPRMYRFLQRVYYLPGVCLIVTAESREALGHLRKLLWDPREEIALKPLPAAEAAELFDAACQAYGLDAASIDEFRRKALKTAEGHPGRILTMCRLASRPEYWSGGRIRFLPVWIDARMAFVS
jgi:hypothetical protein